MATTTETRTNGSNGNGTPQAGGDAAKATVVAPRKSKARRAYMLLLGLVVVALAVYFIHGYATRNEVKTDDGGLRGIIPGLRRAVTVGTIRTSLSCSGHGLLPGHFDVHLLADDPGLTMEKQKRQDEQEQDSLE